MKQLLLALLFMLLPTTVYAQGCGPTNPNCTVPTLPQGTNNNAAASTGFIGQGIVITPTPNTPNYGIDILQIGPTTGATVGAFFDYNLITVNGDNVDATSTTTNYTDALFVHYLAGGSNLKNARTALHSRMELTAPSSATNTNRFYVGGASEVYCNSSDGGTGTTLGTAKGACFGFNGVSDAIAGPPTNLLGIAGVEWDVGMHTAESSALVQGESLVKFGSPGQVAGTGPNGAVMDTAIDIGSNAQSWQNGITFNDIHGDIPLNPHGTILGAIQVAHAFPWTVDYGIDLSGFVFNQAAFRTSNFAIDNGANVLGGSWGVATGKGFGGTVTQITNVNTAVTLNKIAGQITLVNAARVAGTPQTFAVNNTTVTANDTVIVSQAGIGGAAQTYAFAVTNVAANGFAIQVIPYTTETAAPVLNFQVLHGAIN
jgi:hypothetical protein